MRLTIYNTESGFSEELSDLHLYTTSEIQLEQSPSLAHVSFHLVHEIPSWFRYDINCGICTIQLFPKLFQLTLTRKIWQKNDMLK